MIKKLNKNEIEDIQKKINELKDDDYYKNYFVEGEEENFPDSAFLIDDIYYIDFTYYSGACYMGVINLEKNVTKDSFYKLMKLFNERLEHYKIIMMWCKTENEIAMKFHEYLKKRYKYKRYLAENKSVLGVFYEKFKR